MARLDIERQELFEPERMDYALKALKNLEKEIVSSNDKEIRFLHNGKVITLWVYSGWFSGKGIKAGRGINNLIKQLKNL